MRGWYVAIALCACLAIVLLGDFCMWMSGVNYEEQLFPHRFVCIRGDPVPIIPMNMAICCLARNASAKIAKHKARMEALGSLFADYTIIIFENDSSDNTRELLEVWTEENPRVYLLECGDEAPNCVFNAKTGYQLEGLGRQRARMRQMAIYRNRYLEAVRALPRSFTHFIVADFDGAGYIDADGLRSVMSRTDEFDAVAAYGVMNYPPFYTQQLVYDAIAFVDSAGDQSEQLLRPDKQRMWYHVNWQKKIAKGQTLVPVRSAFNGLAIYNRNSVANVQYESLETDVVGCEHVGLHVNMASAGFGRIFVAPELVVQMGQQGNMNRWSYFSESNKIND